MRQLSRIPFDNVSTSSSTSARTSGAARTARAGFTLIELLVVIAIIAILAAILFPVFAQAREKGRQTSCLSNGRQIGIAFLMYAQDYDEFLPLTTFPVAANTWTDQTQPYIKNRGIYRCPSDPSANWDTPQTTKASILDPTPPVVRRASYFLNAYMAGSSRYGNLAAISSPASVIYVAESLEGITRDHFHPFNWNGNLETPTPNPLFSGFMHMATWDDARNETKELAFARHSGGSNYVFLDGHSKWQRWSQVYWQKPEQGIWQGAFDPRQP
ncbi:MAG: DUF1559 domain-containing protein [Capsulimonadales bacterium]|nr:DUF1559 domain-containing protein [Capsulimonadales bacterium]